jgi:hypothetical protein
LTKRTDNSPARIGMLAHRLRSMGFKSGRPRKGKDAICHTYSKTVNGRKVTVKLYRAGPHMASHTLAESKGTGAGRPRETPFRSMNQMYNAIQHEWTVQPRRRAVAQENPEAAHEHC